jgi:hypothetical protein
MQLQLSAEYLQAAEYFVLVKCERHFAQGSYVLRGFSASLPIARVSHTHTASSCIFLLFSSLEYSDRESFIFRMASADVAVARIPILILGYDCRQFKLVLWIGV